MGQQHKTKIKRRRRTNYLKRKKDQTQLGSVSVKKADSAKAAAPVKKAAKKAAKKAVKKAAKPAAEETQEPASE